MNLCASKVNSDLPWWVRLSSGRHHGNSLMIPVSIVTSVSPCAL